MADHSPMSLAQLDDVRLTAALSELGRSIATPPPDALAHVVRRRLEAGGTTRSWTDLLRVPASPSSQRRSMRLALVLALVALAVAVTVAAAGLLGLPGLRFIFGPGPSSPTEPSGSAVPSPSAASSPFAGLSPTPRASLAPGAAFGLGEQVELAGIDQQVGFHVLVPDDPALGSPDAVYFDPDLGAGHVTLVWGAGTGLAPLAPGSDVGLVVTQFRGTLEDEYFAKLIHTGTVLRSVEVGDGTGWWIEGAPHFYFYVGPDGRPVEETRRLVSDMLAFERDGLTVRIESSAGLDRALELAGSLR